MIVVIARLVIKPGTAPLLLEAARRCVAETRKEPGCLSYDLFASVTDPDNLTFVERWENREALSAHARSAHVAEWRAAGADYIIERQIDIVHPGTIESHTV